MLTNADPLWNGSISYEPHDPQIPTGAVDPDSQLRALANEVRCTADALSVYQVDPAEAIRDEGALRDYDARVRALFGRYRRNTDDLETADYLLHRSEAATQSGRHALAVSSLADSQALFMKASAHPSGYTTTDSKSRRRANRTVWAETRRTMPRHLHQEHPGYLASLSARFQRLCDDNERQWGCFDEGHSGCTAKIREIARVMSRETCVARGWHSLSRDVVEGEGEDVSDSVLAPVSVGVSTGKAPSDSSRRVTL